MNGEHLFCRLLSISPLSPVELHAGCTQSLGHQLPLSGRDGDSYAIKFGLNFIESSSVFRRAWAVCFFFFQSLSWGYIVDLSSQHVAQKQLMKIIRIQIAVPFRSEHNADCYRLFPVKEWEHTVCQAGNFRGVEGLFSLHTVVWQSSNLRSVFRLHTQTMLRWCYLSIYLFIWSCVWQQQH